MRGEHTDKRHSEQHAQGLALEEIIRQGARQLIQKAVEAEFEVMLAEYDNVRLLDGRRAVVRNGHLPAVQAGGYPHCPRRAAETLDLPTSHHRAH